MGSLSVVYAVAAASAVLFAAIPTHAASDYALQSVVWVQQSAEYEALCYQAFNAASDRLLEITKKRQSESYRTTARGKPLAVVADLDETVLLNLPQMLQQVDAGVGFRPETFQEWVEQESAVAIPGAEKFLALAEKLGVSIYYISNRSAVNELEPTIANLKKLGLPFASSDHILLKTNTSNKDERRAQIAAQFDIVLFLGDNLGDFSGLYDQGGSTQRKTQARLDQYQYGRKWIVLPNPVYGTWERNFLKFDYPPASSTRADAPKALPDPTAAFRWWVQSSSSGALKIE
jgi:5'-nucleotidase (lipoprotein e(P4) family)